MRTRWMFLALFSALVFLITATAAANERVLFFDDFESDAPGPDALLTNWIVTGPIDVLGPGYFGALCSDALGAANCLDLDGSSFTAAGQIETMPVGLPAGTVSLSFDLAGNQRPGFSLDDTVVVSLGNLYSESFTLGNVVDFQTFTRNIEVPAPTMAAIGFDHSGSFGDRIGLLLDNVRLTALTTELTVTIRINPRKRRRRACFVNDGRGVIPVAIMSSPSFDALQVDPATVQLQGVGVKVRGRSKKLLTHARDINKDDLPDLIVMIEDVAGAFSAGRGTATLTGTLFDGTQIKGSDSICVIAKPKRGRKPKKEDDDD